MMIFIGIDATIFLLLRYSYTRTLFVRVAFDDELCHISNAITNIIFATFLIVLLMIGFYYNHATLPNHPHNTNSCKKDEEQGGDDDNNNNDNDRSTTNIPTTSTTTVPTNASVCSSALTGFSSFIPSIPMYCHSTPHWWKDYADAISQYCTGFMIYDTIIPYGFDKLFFQPWIPADQFIVIHHCFTSIYMISTRCLYAGHLSAMLLMFLGEITAPLMNLIRLIYSCQQCMFRQQQQQQQASESSTLDDISHPSYYITNWLVYLFPYFEYMFSLLFFTVRAILGPWIGLYLAYHLLGTKLGRQYVPLYISSMWLFMTWALLLGAYYWILHCYYILIGTPKDFPLN
jgi:hypothetical protein